MILARATWIEVDALDREAVVVVPVGGCEQHGPSLPLGTSTFVAEAVAHGLHDRLGDDVIVAPTIPYGVSGMDKSFPGTVDLGYEPLIATLRAVVGSFVRHRFRRFLILSGGFEDTRAAVRLALRAIKDESPNLQLADRRAVPKFRRNTVRGRVMLHLHPDLIRRATERPTHMRLAMDVHLDIQRDIVTDGEELLASGLNAVPDSYTETEGADLLAYSVEKAADLVALMREGRIYVERDVIGSSTGETLTEEKTEA